MKARIILFALALYGMQHCQGQQTEGYEQLINRFHSYVDSGSLSGCLIFLEKEGQLKKDVYGYQDIETKAKLTEESIFRIASMTKPLVATAVMQLVEKGKLSLDDAVADYIPEVARMRVFDGTANGREQASTMTISHLLSHTSGITSGLDPSPAGKAAHAVFQNQSVNNLEETGLADLQNATGIRPW
ncbi:MAG: serine hydrolase domain-containing protein [Bacteroidia bacterium]